jgi:hypothetical protein
MVAVGWNEGMAAIGQIVVALGAGTGSKGAAMELALETDDTCPARVGTTKGELGIGVVGERGGRCVDRRMRRCHKEAPGKISEIG